MSKYKICVYAICKNEESFVDRWMDAVSEADMVVVTDTGSTDNTVAKLRARGAVVYEERIVPWRFDTARNIAMDHVPEDIDICVSNDLDEVFEAGWREKLENAWQAEHTRARYWFAWSHHADGRIHKRFNMEKIHLRHGFRWVRPVHEILQYSGKQPDSTVFIDALVLHHYPDTGKPRSQYLPLLELSVEENPQDDRAMFWLGREYLYYGKAAEAVRTLERYLNLPAAVWKEERGAAAYFTAQALQMQGDTAGAQSWFFRAVSECPDTREPWLHLAQFGYHVQDWLLTYFAVQQGLKIEEKTNSYLTDPAAWGHTLHDLGAIACYRLGMYERAYEYADEAVKHRPEDARLQSNLALIAHAAGKAEGVVK